MQLHLNGADLTTGQLLPSPCSLETFIKNVPLPAERHPLSATKGLRDGFEPNDLATCGWAVMVHEDEDPRVLEALNPLLNLRKAQTQNFRYLIYQTGETIVDFMNKHELGMGNVNPRKMPYYLLLVGSPEKIPFSFQHELDIFFSIGRLSFRHYKDYIRYATTVIQHETTIKPTERRVSFFGTDNDDQLSKWTIAHLIDPLSHTLRSQKTNPNWRNLSVMCGKKANKDALLNAMVSDPVDLVITAGHGVCSTGDAEMRARYQGSIISSDWQHQEPLSLNYCLTADDIDTSTKNTSGLCFLFACYSGGTPQWDAYTLPNQKPKSLHECAFISPLAQSLLSNGTLAVIGHVDQAFWHSFLWHKKYRDIGHFEDFLSRITQGYTVGYAMEPFKRRFANVATLMAEAMFKPNPPPWQNLHMLSWLAYQDARQYTILGDPAISW